MNNQQLYKDFSRLSTPLIADDCLRLKISLRLAPDRHYGSVDIFLEAMGSAQPSDILIIDNEGRTDEGCIRDLAGFIVWGCRRDTLELWNYVRLASLFSALGPFPQRLEGRDPEALTSARFGYFQITSEDLVFADADGVEFVSSQTVYEIISIAQQIWKKERHQAQEIQASK